MGDHADDCILNGFEMMMNGEDPWGILPYKYKTKQSVTCKHCGIKNLHWGSTKVGWRLFDRHTDYLHNCVYDFKTVFPNNNPLDGVRIPQDELDWAFFWLVEHCEEYYEEEDFSLSELYVDDDEEAHGECGERSVSKGRDESRCSVCSSKLTSAGHCQRCLDKQFRNARICPHCGDRAGFSPGTGDCGCESSPNVGW